VEISQEFRSAVAVDNADDDDDRHAGERRDSEHQPSVLEAAGDDVAEEQRLATPVGPGCLVRRPIAVAGVAAL